MSRIHKFSYQNPKPEKTAAIVRYGGIGDMIQASSILPGLKAQGYHVTVYTTPDGQHILRDDPHIDAWVIQDKDQVPNGELMDFWEYWAKRYDKFINLSESVEGALLAIPGKSCHAWSHAMRHKHFNKNYLQFVHDIADVPFAPKQRFYASEEEKRTARKHRQQMCDGNGLKSAEAFVILWSLSGSSVHKAWPHLDTIIARLMLEYPQAIVVLCGDELCQMLEAGWEKERRVVRTSGKWGVRQSLAFAQHADLVIGTETGLMNAVGMEEVPKIITLSHSSVENLTKHWKNTTSLEPVSVDCFPCHRMHYGFKYCRRDEETGCAQCQVNISPDMMWDAVKYWVDRTHIKAA